MSGAALQLLRRPPVVLAGILLVAAFLIFFRLTRADLQADDGHYSLRAIGYFDFLASKRQTTPLDWYDTVPPPAWTKLSFHDHPPLVFAIQHLFFRALGVSDAVALLPFALAGLAAVLLTYAIGRRLGGVLAGLLSAGGVGIATFATWSARVGYLEGVENAFVLLAVWLFLKALERERYLPWWGLALGISLLTKYSALFLVPTFGAAVLVHRRQWLRERRFWAALLLTLAVLSPLIVYNFQVWRLRGHLDVQLSTLLPSARATAAQDWPALFDGRPRTVNVAVNLRDLWASLSRAFSLPFTAVLVAGLAWVVTRAAFSRGRLLPDTLLAAGLVSLAVFFSLTAPSLRYLPIMVPWLVLAGALAVQWLWAQLALPRRKYAGAACCFGLAMVAAGELRYNFNTNHARQPAGRPPFAYAGYRRESLGFAQLQRYLEQRLVANPNFPPRRQAPATFGEFSVIKFQPGQDAVFYDSGLLWFSVAWYLQRYWFYQGVPVLHDQDLDKLKIGSTWPALLQRAGMKRAFYVAGLTPAVYDPWAVEKGEASSGKQMTAELERLVAAGAPWTVTTTTDRLGRPAFKVFEIPLNP